MAFCHSLCQVGSWGWPSSASIVQMLIQHRVSESGQHGLQPWRGASPRQGTRNAASQPSGSHVSLGSVFALNGHVAGCGGWVTAAGCFQTAGILARAGLCHATALGPFTLADAQQPLLLISITHVCTMELHPKAVIKLRLWQSSSSPYFKRNHLFDS